LAEEFLGSVTMVVPPNESYKVGFVTTGVVLSSFLHDCIITVEIAKPIAMDKNAAFFMIVFI
jgi:hypothetical protein